MAILALLVAYFRFVHKKRPSPKTPPAITSPLVLTDVPQVKIPGKGDEKTETALRDSLEPVIRDIFSIMTWPKKEEPPPVTVEEPKPKPLPELKLGGTLVGQKKAMAIINNQFFRVGDLIGDFRIVDIMKNRVILRSDDRQIVLEVLEGSKE